MMQWTRPSAGVYRAERTYCGYYVVTRTRCGSAERWDAKVVDANDTYDWVYECGDLDSCIDSCEQHVVKLETERRKRLHTAATANGWTYTGGGGWTRPIPKRPDPPSPTKEELYDYFSKYVPESGQANSKRMLTEPTQPCPDCKNNEKARNCPTCGTDWPG